jgi:3',5'-cyclic-AMP phosphodiesterase
MSAGAPFLLAQISDPHIGATWARGDPAARLAATVDELLRLPDRPDAVLVSGDLADNAAPAEYALVREVVARLEVPTYVLPGNHDVRDTMRGSFALPGAAGEPIQYAADLGRIRLLALDTTRPGHDEGQLDRERLSWLEAELSAAPDRLTIIAMHHPPPLTGSRAWDALCLPSPDRSALAEIIGRNHQVCRIVAGHVHRTITAEFAGIGALTVPSTYVQARLDLSSDEIGFTDEPPAVALHALLDGGMTTHVQPVRSSGSRSHSTTA